MKKQVKTALLNTKGGSTKSTSAVNLASTGAKAGKKVLLVDFDQQKTSTSMSGIFERRDINPDDFGSHRLILEDNISPSQLILETNFGYDIIPASALLLLAETEIRDRDHGVAILSYKFRRDSEALEKYDLIICDTQGSASPLVRAVVSMTEEYIIPNLANKTATEQLGAVTGMIEGLNKERKYLNDFKDIELRAHFFNAAKPTEEVHRESDAELKELFGDKHLSLFYVSNSTKNHHAAYSNMPIVDYEPKHKVSEQYSALFHKMFKELF